VLVTSSVMSTLEPFEYLDLDLSENVYFTAKLEGLRTNITPSPASFNSELKGLLAIENPYLQALPIHLHTAPPKWALVTREDFSPSPPFFLPHPSQQHMQTPQHAGQCFVAVMPCSHHCRHAVWLCFCAGIGATREVSTLATPIIGVQTHEMHSLVPTSTPSCPNSLVS